MAEQDGTTERDDTIETTMNGGVTHRRRRPDPATLVVGVLALLVAVAAFVGDLPGLGAVDGRWLLAVGAVLVGLVLLVGSVRGRRD